jgi:CHAD domain-containing protein
VTASAPSLPAPIAADAALTRPIEALRSLLGVAASTAPEAVHRARTATRRLRSNLRSLARVLDPPEAVRDDLAWLAESLGAVRDADVLAERLTASGDAAPEPIVAGANMLRHVIAEHRDAENDRLRRTVASVRYGSLIHELDVIAKGGSSAVGVVEARDVMRGRWRALRDAVDAATRTPSDRALHEVRIETKRARYAAEICTETGDDRCVRFIRRATAMQDVLGAQHDAARACEWLVTAQLDDAEAARAAGWFANAAMAERDDLRDAWRARWRRLARDKARFW